jgi:BirA family transcriptional regulator, biotin operon repressor / biotin---[acetyl-CoA-carboxylase] ligase
MANTERALPLILRNAAILKALRSTSGTVSIDSLANITGMDMNAATDSIRNLCDMGYPIHRSDAGIELAAPCDFLFPWEFAGREDRIHYFPEIDSTMTEARKMAQAGCPPFTVVIAEHQTQGRGRLKRTWHSAEGGLYFTLVLRPTLRPVDSGQVNFLTSVVLATVLREDYSIDAGVKWPNDILVGNRKIAGLLSEMGTIGHQVNYVNIGIGLNVNNDPNPTEPTAISIKNLLGKPVTRAPILNRFLDRLEESMKKMTWEETLDAWRSLSITRGQRVRVVTARETVEGIAVDVDNTGALIVKLSDGEIKKVIYGDCFLHPA